MSTATDTATEAILAACMHNPKDGINHMKVAEAVEALSYEQVMEVMVDLAAVHLSATAAFQKLAYSPMANPLDFAASSLACACVAEGMSAISMIIPDVFKRDATAQRAHKLLMQARTLAMTSAAGQIILPGEN